jgi:ribosomal-protein-alanine N-acetyltransferase
MSQTSVCLKVRPARAEDIDRIVEIEAVSFPCPWSMQMIRHEILSGGPTSFLVAVSPSTGELVGYIGYSVAADQVHILSLATDPKHRRRGIARALMYACLEARECQGATIAHLEVRESNAAAINLYNQLGFRQVGRRPRYYIKPVEDALLFSLKLDPVPSASATEPS